jgi:anti-sigma B factor antagonist
MLDIKQEIRGGWCVVSVSGRADALTATELETALTSAAEQYDKVALDLASLDYISSAGLRSVLQGARAAQARNGDFVLCSPGPSVSKVLEISGIPNVLKIQGELPC